MGRRVTILYHQPVLVTVDLDDEEVTKVYEDTDNIVVALDDRGLVTMWDAAGNDQFASGSYNADMDDDEDAAQAIMIADNTQWPMREDW